VTAPPSTLTALPSSSSLLLFPPRASWSSSSRSASRWTRPPPPPETAIDNLDRPCDRLVEHHGNPDHQRRDGDFRRRSPRRAHGREGLAKGARRAPRRPPPNGRPLGGGREPPRRRGHEADPRLLARDRTASAPADRRVRERGAHQSLELGIDPPPEIPFVPTPAHQKAIDDAIREAAEELEIEPRKLRPVASRLFGALARSGVPVEAAAGMAFARAKKE